MLDWIDLDDLVKSRVRSGAVRRRGEVNRLVTRAVAEVRLLGPVEVVVAGQRVVLERRQERALLAVLLLGHDHLVSLERLSDLLWDGDPPERHRSLLYTQASRLRSALRAVGAADWLQTAGGGYLVKLPATSLVDADRFRQLVEQARACPTASERTGLWKAGLDLWRGHALAGVGSDRLRHRLCAELEELRLVATEEWLTARFEGGRPSDTIADLARLTAEHPLRERIIELYMRALAAAGRPAEALQAFEEYRDRLAESAGLDPGRGISQIQVMILRGELAEDGGLTTRGRVTVRESSGDSTAEASDADIARARPCQLPHDVVDFTGRVVEADRILTELRRATADASPTVVISAVAGQAGIGKTALAVHVAHQVRGRFADGQLYVNLRGAEPQPVEPAEVLAQFLRALGVPGEAVPERLEERAAMYRSVLADRQVLVVLDNAADEQQIRDLIPGTAGAAVLVTSRRRLGGLAGASLLSLDVLDDDQAADLLARIVGPDRVEVEHDAAAALVRLCAGLPLALRVVGARLAAHPHWSLARMVERLAAEHRRLDELAYADQEVRASLTLSYQGLDESDRRLLRRLALLDAPDFPGWVAAAVLDADHEDGLAALDRLVEVHLIDVVGTDRVGQVRYRFHDLVRLYGRERCAEEESEDSRKAALARTLGGWLVLSQHAHIAHYGNDYFARLCDAPRWNPHPDVARMATSRPVDWLQAERAALMSGVLQAERAGIHAICWECAAVTGALLRTWTYYDDTYTMHQHALAAAKSVGSRRGTAIALYGLGFALLEQYQMATAYESLRTVDDIFRELGDVHGQATVELAIAWIDRFRGNLEDSLARSERAAAIFPRFEDATGEVRALLDTGRIHIALGRPKLALPPLERAEAIVGRFGTQYLFALVKHALGLAYLALGRLADAGHALAPALVAVKEVGTRSGQASVLLGLGRVALGSSRIEEAAQYLAESLTLSRLTREWIIEIQVLQALGELHVAEGDLPPAVDVLNQALAVAERMESPFRAGQVLDQLASVYDAAGDTAAADKARAEAASIRSASETTATPSAG